MTNNEHKTKTFIFKVKEENVEFKEKTRLMKSQAQKLKGLKKTIETQESIKRKWAETLFHYKQQDASSNQVETLIKEKKKKNLLTNLELINLNSVSLLNFEKLKKTTT